MNKWSILNWLWPFLFIHGTNQWCMRKGSVKLKINLSFKSSRTFTSVQVCLEIKHLIVPMKCICLDPQSKGIWDFTLLRVWHRFQLQDALPVLFSNVKEHRFIKFVNKLLAILCKRIRVEQSKDFAMSRMRSMNNSANEEDYAWQLKETICRYNWISTAKYSKTYTSQIETSQVYKAMNLLVLSLQ